MKTSLSLRITKFSLIGAGVAVLGTLEMILFINVFSIEKNVAFVLQSIISLQLNFILNDIITYNEWRRLNGSLVRKWVKFHASKIFAIIANQILFSLMVTMGLHYAIAYISCIVLISIYNFITNDKFVFNSMQP